jgi:hypothetical protein
MELRGSGGLSFPPSLSLSSSFLLESFLLLFGGFAGRR